MRGGSTLREQKALDGLGHAVMVAVGHDIPCRRQEVKELISGLEGRYPDIKQKLFGSLQRYPLYGWNLHEEER